MTDPVEGAQPEAVGDVPQAQEPADAQDAFEAIAGEMLGENQVEDDEPEAEVDAEDAETDELTEDDIEDEAEADDLPPIDAPVSWDAEAKEKFAALPREVQEYVHKRESEREKFVQFKSQEAAKAKTQTEQAAIQQLAEIERSYAQQYQAIAQQFDVPEPDMSLLATDPARFAQQAEVYKRSLAQRQEAQQAAQYYAQQAQQREAQAEQAQVAEQVQIITEHFPEYLDPTSGPKLREELTGVAREMGYPPELISQARAPDILAMRTAAQWKAKAEKLDRLEAKKMEKVRAAKGLPKSVKPGAKVSGDQTRAVRAQAAWERTKSAGNMNDRAEGFAEYLSSTGQI